MIRCPLCKGKSSVIETREHASTVRRRRKCSKCDHRWTTYEVSSTFIDLAAEIPTFIASLVATSDSLRQAVDDYDLHAFGETDRIGRHASPRNLMPRCPKCQSTRVHMTNEADDRHRQQFHCDDCGHDGADISFKRKRR